MSEAAETKILFISSGCSLTGVPVFFVNMIRWMTSNTDFSITILTNGTGPMMDEYAKLAPTFKWDGSVKSSRFEKYYIYRIGRRIISKLFRFNGKSYKEYLTELINKENFELVYINSVASIPIYNELKEVFHCPIILHVHELQISIIQFCGVELFKKNIHHFDKIIAISDAVASNLKKNLNIPEDKLSVLYTFIDTSGIQKILKDVTSLRESLNIPPSAFLIASSGTTDWRKGADLVGQIAKKVLDLTESPVYFIWIGGETLGLEFQKLYYDLEKFGIQDKVHFLGIKENPLEYFAAADVFMLCSREDPVGMVALEAASLKKPILCFDKAGGMPEFVEDDCGFIIPYLDLDSMADHIVLLQNDRHLLKKLGENAYKKVKRHDISIACRDIEKLINSVIES